MEGKGYFYTGGEEYSSGRTDVEEESETTQSSLVHGARKSEPNSVRFQLTSCADKAPWPLTLTSSLAPSVTSSVEADELSDVLTTPQAKVTQKQSTTPEGSEEKIMSPTVDVANDVHAPTQSFMQAAEEQLRQAKTAPTQLPPPRAALTGLQPTRPSFWVPPGQRSLQFVQCVPQVTPPKALRECVVTTTMTDGGYIPVAIEDAEEDDMLRQAMAASLLESPDKSDENNSTNVDSNLRKAVAASLLSSSSEPAGLFPSAEGDGSFQFTPSRKARGTSSS